MRAPPARCAISAAFSVPANSNAIAGFPRLHARTHRVNHPSHFVPWDSRILDSWPQPLFDHRVAVAHAARLDFNSHRARARLRNFPFHKFERGTGARHLHHPHLCHY